MLAPSNPVAPGATLSALIAVALAIATALVAPALAHDGAPGEIEATTRRLAEHPRDVEALLRRAELRRLAGDWSGAEADLKAVRRLAPARLEIDLCEAALAIDRGAPAAAMPGVDRYLAARPDDPEALRLRARARLALGAARGAVADLDRAIAACRRVTPDDYLDRAGAQRAAGFTAEQVLGGLDAGIARLGNVVSLVMPSIDIEIERGRHDAALARLDRLAPGSARLETLLERRAAILASAGRVSESRAAYAAALAEIESISPEQRARRTTSDLEARIRAALAGRDAAHKMVVPGSSPAKGATR